MSGKLVYIDSVEQALNKAYGEGNPLRIGRILKNVPAVDAVEVVRCRQCCFGVKKRERGEVVTYCGLFWGMKGVLDPNGFCSYGKEINDAKTN